MTIQNANIFDTINSMEVFTVSWRGIELEIDPKKGMYQRLANAALNSAITGFNSYINTVNSIAAKTGNGNDGLAELEDALRPTEMQEYLEQKTALEMQHEDAVIAARLYNYLCVDFRNEKDPYARPCTVQKMLEIRTSGSDNDEVSQGIRDTAAILNLTEAQVIASSRESDLRRSIGLLKNASEIKAMILDAGGFLDEDQPNDQTVLQQLTWTSKLVNKTIEAADKTVLRVAKQPAEQPRANYERLMALQNCKILEQFANRLIIENAEELYTLESRGRAIPVIDVEQAQQEAKAKMLLASNKRIEALQKEMEELRKAAA